jgi:UDP-glucose 4-epimerase
MKNIVVFGATGNVGSHLAQYAKQYFDPKEYNIIATGRRDTDHFAKKGIDYYSVDILKESDFEKLPKDDIYAVMLLAAAIPSYMSEYDPRKYINSNIVGAFNVLEYCRINKIDRILYTQTVFDISLSATDNTILPPNTPRNFSFKGDHAVYVISKNAAIDLIEHYHQEYGIKRFIFRLPTIYNYSPYHYYFPNGKKTKRPIYQMIEKAMKSEPIEIWGDPSYAKDMVHVNDFSQMLCKAVEADRSEGFYNVGTGVPVSLKEQIETIVEIFSPKDNPSEIKYAPEKPCGGGFIMDVSNAKEELGYEPKYSCRDLLLDYKKEMTQTDFDDLLKRDE